MSGDRITSKFEAVSFHCQSQKGELDPYGIVDRKLEIRRVLIVRDPSPVRAEAEEMRGQSGLRRREEGEVHFA